MTPNTTLMMIEIAQMTWSGHPTTQPKVSLSPVKE
jgi:hypothetical protein